MDWSAWQPGSALPLGAAILYYAVLYGICVSVCLCVCAWACVFARLGGNTRDQGRPESPSPRVARRDRCVRTLEGRRVLKEANFVVGQRSACWVQFGELHPRCICGTGRDAEGGEPREPSGSCRLAAVALRWADKYLFWCSRLRWASSRQQPPEGVMRALRVPVVTQLRCSREDIISQEPRE